MRTSLLAPGIACALAVTVFGGCGGDAAAPPVPRSLAIVGGDGQTGTVGTTLAQPLRVQVIGSDNRPFVGAAVTWSVTAGGGIVSPASSVTDAGGIASTTLTLGRTAGLNSVTASVPGVPQTATFTATALAGPAAALHLVSGNAQAGVVGRPLPLPLVVRVEDAFGNRVQGATVLFSTAQGTLNPPQASTNVQGEAQTVWTLGTVAGVQTATATLAGVPPVTFTATAAPGPPQALRLTTPPSPIAETMVPLPQQPVLQAVDAYGNPTQAALVVSAVVTQGPGNVAAGGTAATDAQGIARFTGLTLGAVGGRVGPLTLQFSAPGVNPATSNLELRCHLLPLTLGQPVTRSLTTGDCTWTGFSDWYVNRFEIQTTGVTAVQLTQDGNFQSRLSYRYAIEPGTDWYDGLSQANSNRVSFKVFLPPGRNRVIASSHSPGATGTYTLVGIATSLDISSCEFPRTAGPITVTQRLTIGDCVVAGFFEDYLIFTLRPDASVTASMTTSQFVPQISIHDFDTGVRLTFASNPGTAVVSFVNRSGGDKRYFLRMTSAVAGATGVYVLTVTLPSGATPGAVLGGPARLTPAAAGRGFDPTGSRQVSPPLPRSP